jgi:hypothetical protein
MMAGAVCLRAKTNYPSRAATVQVLHEEHEEDVQLESTPISAEAGSTLNIGASAVAEVYARCLDSKDYGYPMWNPKPLDHLPLEFRDRGVFIGDVGTITPEGSFNFLFNAFLPSESPINQGRTPSEFIPFPNLRSDMLITSQSQPPGSVIASKSVILQTQ